MERLVVTETKVLKVEEPGGLVRVLVVAGGGGGGGAASGGAGGGGGAGGVLLARRLSLPAGEFLVMVGQGGEGGEPGGKHGKNGGDSGLLPFIRARGGGAGAGSDHCCTGEDGGSGGGGFGHDGEFGRGVPLQGHRGGLGGGFSSTPWAGGGGGAGGPGDAGPLFETVGDPLEDAWQQRDSPYENPTDWAVNFNTRRLERNLNAGDWIFNTGMEPRGEMFVQAVINRAAGVIGTPARWGIFVRGTNDPNLNLYQLTSDGLVGGSSHDRLVMRKATDGSLGAIGNEVWHSTVATSRVHGQDHTLQLFVADGVQEGWGRTFLPAIEEFKELFITGNDTDHDEEDSRIAGITGQRPGEADLFQVFRSKYSVIHDAPAGWSAEVLNHEEDVVQSATTSGGKITLDLSRHGGDSGSSGATEEVPFGGWPVLQIKDDMGVVRGTIGPIMPGAEIDWDEGLEFQDDGDIPLTGAVFLDEFLGQLPGPETGNGGPGVFAGFADLAEITWDEGEEGFFGAGGGGGSTFTEGAGIGGKGGGGDGAYDDGTTEPPYLGGAPGLDGTGSGGGGGTWHEGVALGDQEPGGKGGNGIVVIEPIEDEED